MVDYQAWRPEQEHRRVPFTNAGAELKAAFGYIDLDSASSIEDWAEVVRVVSDILKQD